MDREAMDALRHDRRLLRRRSWITPEEAAQAETALPDVAEKATTLGEAADAAEAPAPAAPPSTPEP